MPASNLPPRADAMYTSGWWNFATAAADAGFGSGGWDYTLTDATSAGAQLAGQYRGLETFDTVGLSQMFSRARSIANASLSFTQAEDHALLDESMVGLAPWARSDAEMAAQPAYQIKAHVTYVDEFGTEYTEILTATDTGPLSRTVGGMRGRIADKMDALLAAGENTRYPSGATLTGIGRITILAV